MQRLTLFRSQLQSSKLSNKDDKNSITITDNRTGKTYNFQLKDGVLKASDIETIKDSNGKPLRSYDPAFMNTISCVNIFLT
jgi:citrate synthase